MSNSNSSTEKEIAIKMLHQQHTRWYQWSIFFFGSVAALFTVWAQLDDFVPVSVVALLATLLCLCWTLAAQNIRAQTRSWQRTINAIENGTGETAFSLFEKKLDKFERGKDFRGSLRFWNPRCNRRVTRLLVLVAAAFTLVFFVLFFCTAFFIPVSSGQIEADTPASISYRLDWNGIGSIFGGVGTIGLAVIAGMGLKTWRKQLKGTTEYDLARKLYLAALKVRDEIRSIRNPFRGLSREDFEKYFADKGFAEEEIEKILLNKSLLNLNYGIRLSSLKDFAAELETEKLECEAIFADDFKNVLEPLLDCVRELIHAVGRYIMFHEHPQLREDNDQEFDHVMSIVVSPSTATLTDPFFEKVNAAIEVIKEFVKPRLHS